MTGGGRRSDAEMRSVSMERLVFAFDPDAKTCHPTIYDRETDINAGENPYAVADSDERIACAIEALPRPMHSHRWRDGETYWIRYDYATLVDPHRATKRIDPTSDTYAYTTEPHDA